MPGMQYQKARKKKFLHATERPKPSGQGNARPLVCRSAPARFKFNSIMIHITILIVQVGASQVLLGCMLRGLPVFPEHQRLAAEQVVQQNTSPEEQMMEAIQKEIGVSVYLQVRGGANLHTLN